MNHATGLIYKYLLGRRKQESLLNGLLYVRSGQRDQIKSEMNGVSDNGQRTGAESAQLSHSRQGSHFSGNMTRSLNKAWYELFSAVDSKREPAQALTDEQASQHIRQKNLNSQTAFQNPPELSPTTDRIH